MSKEFILNPRGKLENADVNIYKEVTGRNLTQQELRLLPFIQNCFANEKLMNGHNLNEDEKDILKEMNDVGLINFGRAKGYVGFYFVEINEPLWNIIVKLIAVDWCFSLHCFMRQNIRRTKFPILASAETDKIPTVFPTQTLLMSPIRALQQLSIILNN